MKKALADRARRFEQLRLAQKIAPVGTVVETFSKGTLVKSSLDLAKHKAGTFYRRARRREGLKDFALQVAAAASSFSE
jgi:hypothetical protein